MLSSYKNKQNEFKGIAMPRISISTLLFIHRPLVTAVEKISEMGFSSVELFCDLPQVQNQINRSLETKLKKIVNSRKLRVTMHAPVHDLNIASPNHFVRKIALGQCLKNIKIAVGIGARIVTIHSGTRSSHDLSRDEYWNYALDSISKCVNFAGKEGITIGVENLPPNYLGSSIDEIEKIFIAITEDNLGITLDTGHANMVSKTFALQLIDKLGEHVVHTHLSDNNGLVDQHLPLDASVIKIDYSSLFKALKRKGYKSFLNLEIKSLNNPRKAALKSKEFLEKKWKEVKI